MIIVKDLYTTIENLRIKLAELNFSLENECTVELYTANYSKGEAVIQAKAIKKLLPNCQLIGSSASGVIFCGEQYDNGTLILIKQYEICNAYAVGLSWEGRTPREFVTDILLPYRDQEIQMIHILFSDHYHDVYEFVESFNRIKPDIKLVGGIAGDILNVNLLGYVFTEEGIIDQGAVLLIECGDQVSTYSGVNIAHEPISPVYTITKTDGSYWETIDNIPSVKWFKEHLGIEDMKEYGEWEDIVANDPLVWFQAVLEDHHGASRYVRYEEKEQRILQYFSKLPEGTRFRISYMAPSKCVQKSYDICGDIVQKPIEELFAYSCLFRKMYMKNCARWELAPYKDFDICGIFMMGEIGNIEGRNEFLNGACVLAGVAEKEIFQIPDSNVFQDLYKIEDENRELLNYVLRKQTETITSMNQELLEQILKQQKVMAEQVKIDPQSRMYNTIKYKSDRNELGLDKLCLVQVENVDTLYRYMGQSEYVRLLRKTIWRIRDYVRKSGLDKILHFYAVNESTFAVASSSIVKESVFVEAIDQLYKKYQFIKIDSLNISIINRFVIIMYEKKMLENALYTLQVSKESQSHYIVWNKDNNKMISTGAELKMLNVIRWALESDGVVPYYQGIHDNDSNKISKYEALMRLRDEDGKIYSPFEFMDIAKKYHLYSKISREMINRVFQEFENGNVEVSINLSAYDVESDDFNRWLFEKLEHMKNPERFIFEILEDENFGSLTVLDNFIKKIRTYGVKIAVDDFGSGYSNLMKIARISPDYIKIDGDIVKEVPNDKNNKVILEVIVYLAEQLGSRLVAEFVENEQIQSEIVKMGVKYSQGYYFSRPAPYESIATTRVETEKL